MAKLLAVIVFWSVAASSAASTTASSRAAQDIRTLVTAIEQFKDFTCTYPTEAEGLNVLATSTSQAPECLQEDGLILVRIPRDPWDNEYQYQFPGTHNPQSFDVWSWGADGLPGGTGLNADCGNWRSEECELRLQQGSFWGSLWLVVALPIGAGFVLGLPVWVAGFIQQRKAGATIRAALLGFHLGVVLYLMAALTITALAISLWPSALG